jgi:hypothetical protein
MPRPPMPRLSADLARAAREAWGRGDRERAVEFLQRGFDDHPEVRHPDGTPIFADALLARLIELADASRLSILIPQISARHGQEDLAWLDEVFRRRGRRSDDAQRQMWASILAEHGLTGTTLTAALSGACCCGMREEAAGLALLVQTLPEEAQADPRLWCLAGDAALLNHELDQATEAYLRALRLQPDDPRATLGIAVVNRDRGDLARAAELAGSAAEILRAEGKENAARLAAFASRWADPTRRIETVEVVIFSHVTHKLVRNKHLAAPGVGLVNEAVTSIRRQLQSGDVPVTVFYDHKDTPLNDAYYKALVAYCDENDIALIRNESFGLRDQWVSAFARSKADAVLIVEQDHRFLEGAPTVAEMVERFNQRPDVNFLRLSRRRTMQMGFDYVLSVPDRDRASGLVLTGRFGNTPIFLRSDFYREVLEPIILHQARAIGRNGGAGGVEESINHVMRGLELEIGAPLVMRLMGLAAWGNLGDPARSEHLGV